MASNAKHGGRRAGSGAKRRVMSDNDLEELRGAIEEGAEKHGKTVYQKLVDWAYSRDHKIGMAAIKMIMDATIVKRREVKNETTVQVQPQLYLPEMREVGSEPLDIPVLKTFDDIKREQTG